MIRWSSILTGWFEPQLILGIWIPFCFWIIFFAYLIIYESDTEQIQNQEQGEEKKGKKHKVDKPDHGEWWDFWKICAFLLVGMLLAGITDSGAVNYSTLKHDTKPGEHERMIASYLVRGLRVAAVDENGQGTVLANGELVSIFVWR